MEICNREDRLYGMPCENALRLVDNGEKLRREKVSTLRELIDALYEAYNTDNVNIDYVQDLMMNYKSNPADWKKFAKFDRYRYLIFIYLYTNFTQFYSHFIKQIFF